MTSWLLHPAFEGHEHTNMLPCCVCAVTHISVEVLSQAGQAYTNQTLRFKNQTRLQNGLLKEWSLQISK